MIASLFVLVEKLNYSLILINVLYQIYPWAEFEADYTYYENHCKGDDELELPPYLQDELDLRASVKSIERGYGEIHFYRMVISLNETGQAFLALNKYLEM